MSTVPIITVDALTQRLAAGSVVELWNVLTDDYFTGEMIPGSRRVPLDQVGREIATSRLARDTAIVVYCSGPRCPQSRAAAEKLVTLGFTEVRAFEGGLEAWKAAGQRVERPMADRQWRLEGADASHTVVGPTAPGAVPQAGARLTAARR
jgi:rhodanese-related sulfurtransferase